MTNPRHLQKSFRRGVTMHKAGRLAEALPIYIQILKDTGLIAALNPYTAQIARGEAFDATEIRRLVANSEFGAAALHQAALVTRSLSDHARANGLPPCDAQALRFLTLAVMAAPNNAGSLHNLAKLKADRGEIEEARHFYERAVECNPNQGESWVNLGNVYGEMGNALRAEACWYRALECPTPSAEATYNLSFLKLLKGNYADGWRDYEARWISPDFLANYGRPDLRAPRWKGDYMRGTLYLHQEQGAGDALMMARYVPLAMERCERVIIEVIRGLVDLFGAMFPGVEIIARGNPAPRHAAQLPMLSLPSVFGTTLETIPDSVSFRPTAADGVPIQAEPGRIGLCWRGSTTHTNDRVRSMPFEATFPLLDLATSHGLTFQSLQFGYVTEPPLDPLPPGDFLETARQIARCACVVTVDTSIAHLAGVMGVPTIVLLPFASEFRWLQSRGDSPWYPSARLVRQSKAGDWGEVIDRVATVLVPVATTSEIPQ